MHFPLVTGEIEECRDAAAQVIRKHRRSDRGVAVLESGSRWEMLEDENGFMVNDDEGVLVIKEV
jgi:hypothetical protein